MLAVVPSLSTNLSGIRALRALRVLRIFRFIVPLRQLLEALAVALKFLVDGFILFALVSLIFSIVGLQLFSGALSKHCVPVAGGLWDVNQCCSTMAGTQGYRCPTGYVCNQTGINPRYDQISYDNFALAWIAVFQCLAPEMWSQVAIVTMDATTQAAIIYYVAHVFLSVFGFMVLFKAVVTSVLLVQLHNREEEEIKVAHGGHSRKSEDGKAPGSCCFFVVR